MKKKKKKKGGLKMVLNSSGQPVFVGFKDWLVRKGLVSEISAGPMPPLQTGGVVRQTSKLVPDEEDPKKGIIPIIMQGEAASQFGRVMMIGDAVGMDGKSLKDFSPAKRLIYRIENQARGNEKGGWVAVMASNEEVSNLKELAGYVAKSCEDMKDSKFMNKQKLQVYAKVAEYVLTVLQNGIRMASGS